MLIYLSAFLTVLAVIAAWKKSRRYRYRADALETALKKDQEQAKRKAAAIARFEDSQE